MQIFIAKTPTAIPTTDNVLQAATRVSAMYSRTLWMEILLLLLVFAVSLGYFKTFCQVCFLIFFVNSRRCRFGHIVSSLAVNSDSYRGVLEVRLYVNELWVEQLNIESFREGRLQIGIQC